MKKEHVDRLRGQLTDMKNEISDIERSLDQQNYGEAADSMEWLEDLAHTANQQFDDAVAEIEMDEVEEELKKTE